MFEIQCIGIILSSIKITGTSVADPGPGSGAFLPQGSGIRDDFFPDPGSRIQDPGSLPRPKFKILPLKMAKNRKN
jgi:hypothetical protein